MKCEEARAALLGGELDAAEQKALESHLSGCRACRAQKPVLERMRSLISSPSLWEEASPELGDRIVGAIDSRKEKASQPRMSWRAAAAAVLVLGLGGFGLAQLARSEPDWTINLATLAPLPDAMAVVEGWRTSSGTRMIVEVSGIAQAPVGFYYEIWMSSPDGRHISGGSFTGPGTVTAFAGVRRSDFPRVWITLEEIGGDLGPSRQTYFDMPEVENRRNWPQGV
jgi:hypothetical protein